MNASGVIAGLMTILGVYLLGRDLFHPRVGLLGAALLTISYAHLAASRQSSYIDPVPLLVFSIYFLLLGLREESRWAIAASGMLAALCVQMHFSGRIVALIVALLFVYLLLSRTAWLRQRGPSIDLWTLATAITLGPMLSVFVTDRDRAMERSQAVFVLSPDNISHQQGVYQTHSVASMLAEQVRHSALPPCS